MRFLSRARLAAAVLITHALLLPTAAGAVPISFEFSGVVTQAGDYAPTLAIGDPFTAILRYDSEMPVFISGGGTSVYARGSSGFVFEIHAGGFTWATPGGLSVRHDGSRFTADAAVFGQGLFWLEGPGLIPTGGGLPTSLDLSLATVRATVTGHIPIAEGGQIASSRLMQGTITNLTAVTAVPEPATLTLSALGLAALTARRRRNRRRGSIGAAR